VRRWWEGKVGRRVGAPARIECRTQGGERKRCGKGGHRNRGGVGRPWPGDGGDRRWETHLTGGPHLPASA
jgi:hypothetical protein